MKRMKFTVYYTFIAILFIGCSKETPAPEPSAQGTSLRELAAGSVPSPFTIDADAYDSDFSTLPIGVFDSGIGGLTVLAEILKADRFDNDTGAKGADGRPDFENERFIYLGDQANMPYGNYSAENKVDFLKELILKDAIFLLGNRYWPSGDAAEPRFDKPPVKAVVIACNTATAYGLMDVRSAIEYWNIPIYTVGVVEAGAQGAVDILKENGNNGAVGVMATVGTCESMGYVEAIERMADKGGIGNPDIIQQGSVGLAGAVEGDESFVSDPAGAGGRTYRGPSADNDSAPLRAGLIEEYGFAPGGLIGDPSSIDGLQLNSVENYIRYDTAMLVENQRNAGGEPLSAVILGCTHFPFYVDSIRASFERLRDFTGENGTKPYKAYIAENITFIDPAVLTAEQLFESLRERKLLLADVSASVIPVDEFYISVPNTGLGSIETTGSGAFTYEYKYSRSTGWFDGEYVKRVPMSGANLTAHIQKSIAGTMPEVWKRLIQFTNESPRCDGLTDSARLEQ